MRTTFLIVIRIGILHLLFYTLFGLVESAKDIIIQLNLYRTSGR